MSFGTRAADQARVDQAVDVLVQRLLGIAVDFDAGHSYTEMEREE